jgi:hypothetical protein
MSKCWICNKNICGHVNLVPYGLGGFISLCNKCYKKEKARGR